MRLYDIDNQITEWCQTELKKTGEKASGGLGNYYASKLRNIHGIISVADEVLFLYIHKHFPRPCRVLEICGGLCQLGHTLAMTGYDVMAAETGRYNLARRLGAFLGSNCTVSHQRWQGALVASCDVLVTYNAVASANDLQGDEPFFQEALNYGIDVIFNPSLYGRKNDPYALNLACGDVVDVGMGAKHYIPIRR